MASVVAMKVCGTVTTTSPCLTSHAMIANLRASVPLLMAIEWLVPQKRRMPSRIFHHGTANESGGVENLVKDSCKFLLHLNVGGHEVENGMLFRLLELLTL